VACGLRCPTAHKRTKVRAQEFPHSTEGLSALCSVFSRRAVRASCSQFLGLAGLAGRCELVVLHAGQQSLRPLPRAKPARRHRACVLSLFITSSLFPSVGSVGFASRASISAFGPYLRIVPSVHNQSSSG